MTARYRPVHRSVLVFALAVLVSCTNPTRDEVSRLAARVDSLAVIVAAMRATMPSHAMATGPDTVTVATAGAAVLGPESAPVTIVEFTDYQCPFCARHARTTLPSIIGEFVEKGTVRYIIRDLPLEMHPLARSSAKAARCASGQGDGRYWQYHDALFEAQPHLAESSFVAIARKLGLDLPRFETCLGSEKVAQMVERDVAAAVKAGLTGTPSFVIGRTTGAAVTGTVVRGAYPPAQFRQVIEGTLRSQ